MAAAAGSIGDLSGSGDSDNKRKNPPVGKVKGSNQNLHGSASNLAHDNESKKKAALANSIIEKKRASLDMRHRYLIEKFAQYIDEKQAVIENSLLLGNKLELVNEFFAEGGPRKVLFFWQKVAESLFRMTR
jgi:dynein heavy chain